MKKAKKVINISIVKRSFEKKTIDKLKVQENEITDPNGILYELRKFYENLFASKNPSLNTNEFQNLLITPGTPTLSGDDKEQCEGDNKLAEC